MKQIFTDPEVLKQKALSHTTIKMKKHLFLFPNKGLEAIFKIEIRGQLSDGAWENALPYNHWQFWCNLDTATSESGGFEFIKEGSALDQDKNYRWFDTSPAKRTGYNLSCLVDPKCVDLSYRMRAYYVDALYGFNVGGNADFIVSENGVITPEKVFEICKQGEYWQQKMQQIFKDRDVAEFLADFRTKYDSYTRKDLLKDLRAIKAGMKQVISVFYT